MTLQELIQVLYARRRWAVAFVAILVAVVAAWSYLTPKTYFASAAVMIDTKSNDPIVQNNGSMQSTGTGYLATQVDLIQTERVAQRAVRTLGLVEDAEWKAEWLKATEGRGDYLAWVTEQLTKKLEVRPSRESNIVTIGYLSRDPAFAAAAANAFVRGYIDTTLEMKVEPARQYNGFFDDRARQLRGVLEQAQERLSGYQREKGIVATDERFDIENARLAELSSQVVTLQGIATESATRRSEATADSREVLANPTIGVLTAEMSRQEARLNEVSQRLGARHPEVVELTANLEQLRSRLAAETRRVAVSVNQTSKVDQARLGSAQAMLNEQRAKVLRMRAQRDEAAVLLRDVESARRNYDAALAKSSQSSLESQSAFTNVSVVKTATPPPFAIAPRPLLNIAVALVVGSLLAVGFALLLESLDRRVRFDSDIVDTLGQSLLVRIPAGAGVRAQAAALDRAAVRLLPTSMRSAS